MAESRVIFVSIREEGNSPFPFLSCSLSVAPPASHIFTFYLADLRAFWALVVISIHGVDTMISGVCGRVWMKDSIASSSDWKNSFLKGGCEDIMVVVIDEISNDLALVFGVCHLNEIRIDFGCRCTSRAIGALTIVEMSLVGQSFG